MRTTRNRARRIYTAAGAPRGLSYLLVGSCDRQHARLRGCSHAKRVSTGVRGAQDRRARRPRKRSFLLLLLVRRRLSWPFARPYDQTRTIADSCAHTMGLIRDLPYLLAVGAIAFVFFAATEPDFLPAVAVLVPQALQMIGLQFMIPDSPIARYSPTRIPLAGSEHRVLVTHPEDPHHHHQQTATTSIINNAIERIIATNITFEVSTLAYGGYDPTCRGAACPVCPEFIDMDPGRRRDIENHLISTGGPASMRASRAILTARSRAFTAPLDVEQISDIFSAPPVRKRQA